MLDEWDPIGIQGIEEAKDEYNEYASSLCQLLILGKSEGEVFEYLWWLETEHMGLSGDMEKTKVIAKRLGLLEI